MHTELTDTDKAEEKRRTISISKNRMTIKGIPVQLGRTTRQELEKIIGPPDHVVEIGRPICIWDKAGFRGYFSPKSEWLDYFDCIFVVESDLETEPENTFAGEFALERTLISKATTKQSLQGKLSQPMRDHSFDLPGFSVDYPHVSISFEPTRDAKGLASVRFAAPLSKGPGR
ncbi:MAG: hypothetical protein HY040_05885 [Planctomycetes bacterium]|nr:hypothetical protein [Planctomycetota bacterium]